MVSRSFSDLALQLSLQSQLEIERNAKKKLTKELEIAQRDAGASREKVIEAQCEAERIEALHVSRRERRSNELKELWAIHFPNIDFRQQPLRWAAEQDFVSRLEIERALKELSQADDPVTLSRSRMHVSKDHHSGFTIPNGVACRLYFAVHSGRIEVRNMCKKKDDKAR